MNNNCEDRCVFTGIVPQVDGKYYLAACDILVSPTVKNPDGTPFFGSPTKVFEYMAMGRAIIVSGMDQMQEICSNNENALFVEPGNKNDLADKLLQLIKDDALRKYLGENARNTVCDKYTWGKNTDIIMNEVMRRCR